MRFNIGAGFDSLASAIRRNLYRITQEALANAARHSKTTGAEVCLSIENGHVHLKIRDQGQGFIPELALAREHNRERFGLLGIQERVEGLGGTCEILSMPDQGTQILISVPNKAESLDE